jgi:hypothetical protein
VASTCHWEVRVAEVAVIGAGVAGLTAAYVLQRRHDVTLFEADDRLGGHAHTHDIGGVAVDSGFIVHNDATYPHLLRLFGELGVATQDSEMSMSVRDEASGLEYAGARGVRGLFAQPRNLANVRYLRMLGEVLRFHRQARAVVDGTSPLAEEDVRGVPRRRRLLAVLRRHVRGARGVRGVVVGPDAVAAVPGALPVRVPRQPRAALGRRVAPLAHGRRRVALRRRARGEGPRGGGGVDPRAGVGALRRRGARPRRRRRRAPFRPGRRRRARAGRAAPCSSRPRPTRSTCSVRSATRATRPGCTPTRRCSRAPRAPGRRATCCGCRGRSACS